MPAGNTKSLQCLPRTSLAGLHCGSPASWRPPEFLAAPSFANPTRCRLVALLASSYRASCCISQAATKHSSTPLRRAHLLQVQHLCWPACDSTCQPQLPEALHSAVACCSPNTSLASSHGSGFFCTARPLTAPHTCCSPKTSLASPHCARAMDSSTSRLNGRDSHLASSLVPREMTRSNSPTCRGNCHIMG